jgi:Zn-dependent protease with chaperone function
MTIYQELYNAQDAAQNAYAYWCLQPTRAEYIQNQSGLTRWDLWLSDKAYDVSCMTASIWDRSILGGHYILQKIGLDRCANRFCSINPINGKSQWLFIPRIVEKSLANFFPFSEDLSTFKSSELVAGTNSTISDSVSTVFKKLCLVNKSLLNPEGEQAFKYEVRAYTSLDINAYAVPGGGVRVSSQMIKEIAGAIAGKVIKTSEVKFPDGSILKIDLSSVKVDDVIAALVGHELTHIASRHAVHRISIQMILGITIGVLAIPYVMSRSVVLGLYAIYVSGGLNLSAFQKVLAKASDSIAAFTDLGFSRAHEYEADITGVYFAKAAGYNPLGGLYLQELLRQGVTPYQNDIHSMTEWGSTHPTSENRMRALCAGINKLSPEILQGAVISTELGRDQKIDLNRAGKAFQWVREYIEQLSQVRQKSCHLKIRSQGENDSPWDFI